MSQPLEACGSLHKTLFRNEFKKDGSVAQVSSLRPFAVMLLLIVTCTNPAYVFSESSASQKSQRKLEIPVYFLFSTMQVLEHATGLNISLHKNVQLDKTYTNLWLNTDAIFQSFFCSGFCVYLADDLDTLSVVLWDFLCLHKKKGLCMPPKRVFQLSISFLLSYPTYYYVGRTHA